MKRRTSYLVLGVLFIVGAIVLSYVGFAQEAAKPEVPKVAAPETRQLDELTATKLQNVQLQMTLLQRNAQDIIDAYMKANKLNPDEWNIDLQKMVLTKKASEKVPEKADKK